MCNRFCFQAQIIINRYLTQTNIQGISENARHEKNSLYKTPRIHETGTLNTSSTLPSIVASRKHAHKFPALASGASAVVLKTTTLDKPLALHTRLASGVGQDHGGVKEPRGGRTECRKHTLS